MTRNPTRQAIPESFWFALIVGIALVAICMDVKP